MRKTTTLFPESSFDKSDPCRTEPRKETLDWLSAFARTFHHESDRACRPSELPISLKN